MSAVVRLFVKLQDVADSFQRWSRPGGGAEQRTAESSGHDPHCQPPQRSDGDGDGGGGGGPLYVSSIAVNIALSLFFVSVARVAHAVYLSRTSRRRSRAILLKQIRDALAKWERPCLEEILECFAVSRTEPERLEVRHQLQTAMGGQSRAVEADALLALWASVAKKPTHGADSSGGGGRADSARGHDAVGSDTSREGGRAFYGMTSTVAYAAAFPLVSLARLCSLARELLSLEEDRRLLRRLECVLQYAVFRRAALIEEACYYTHLWRRSVLMRGGATDEDGAVDGEVAPPLRKGFRLYHAWRVYGRPSWVIPFSPEATYGGGEGAGGAVPRRSCAMRASMAASASSTATATSMRHYLCLPHSYFPLEALQCVEPFWYRKLASTILADWRRHSPHDLTAIARKAAEAMSLPPRGARGGGGGGGNEWTRLAAQAAAQFWFVAYASPLLRQINQASNTLSDERHREKLFHGVARSTGRGVDELLFDCGASTLRRGSPVTAFGIRGVFQHAESSKWLHRLLALEALSHAVGTVLRLSDYSSFLDRTVTSTAVVLLRYVANTRASTAVAASATATSSASRPDELMDVVTQTLVYSTLSFAASRILQSVTRTLFLASMKELSAIYEEEARVVFANTDEAFFQRVAGNDGNDEEGLDDYGVFSPSVPSRVIDDSVANAREAMNYFDETTLFWLRSAVTLIAALYRGEMMALVVNHLFSGWLSRAPHWFSVRLGFVFKPEVQMGIWRLEEESLPTDAPRGLSLLLDLLAEEEEEEEAGSHGEDKDTDGRDVGASSSSAALRHPFLSLIVCAAVWDHDGSRPGRGDVEQGEAAETTTTAATVLDWPERRPFALRRLYRRVAEHPFEGDLLEYQRRTEGRDDRSSSSSGALCHAAAATRASSPSASVVSPWRRAWRAWRAKRALRAGSGARGLALVEALLEDVACIGFYAVEDACRKRWKVLQWHRKGSDKAPSPVHHHPAMDPVEVATVQSYGYRRYLPTNLQPWMLFNEGFFVLRQLGLELVFAHRAITTLEQSSMKDQTFKLDTAFSSPFDSPLEAILTTLCEFASSLALIAATSTSLTKAGLMMRPRPAWELLQVWQHLSDYTFERNCSEESFLRREVRGKSMVDYPLLAPVSIGDESAYAQCAALRARRQAWRSFLREQHEQAQAKGVSGSSETSPSPTPAAALGVEMLQYDDSGRICGGFRMRDGIALHHITFAYPQLCHDIPRAPSSSPSPPPPATTGFDAQCTVRPTLSDVSAHFSATSMTAIVGRTGSGKSSIARLLKRCYDPLPVIAVVWPTPLEGARRGQREEGVEPRRQAEESGVVEEWTERLLCEVIWLQWVENPLPLPPTSSLPAKASASGCRGEGEGTCVGEAVDTPFAFLPTHSYLSWDGVPISCFSTSYVRRWLAHLDQHPTVVSTMTFEENVRYLSLGVLTEDIESALALCQCASFVNQAPLGPKSVVGTLSGGERQRLALARVIAGVKGRIRLETFRASAAALCADGDSSSGDTDDDDDDGASGSEAEGGLLLDEPTSRLDAHNELLVQTSIAKLLPRAHTRGGRRGRGGEHPPAHVNGLPSLMVIAIAHRMATLQRASHMVVVEDGRVTCEGPVDEVRRDSAFVRAQLQLQQLHSGLTPEEGETGEGRGIAEVQSGRKANGVDTDDL